MPSKGQKTTDKMWELVQIGSGHLSLENDCLEADAIKDILPALEKKFGKRMKFSGRLDLALAASAAELLIDEARITLGWDNWSGFLSCHGTKMAIGSLKMRSPIFL